MSPFAPLNTVTVTIRGSLTVSPDESWEFNGKVTWYDKYDFDPHWFSSTSLRTGMSEVLVIATWLAANGKPYTIQGMFAAKQSSTKDASIVWDGEWEK
jgi:hypothetical protein